MKRAAIYIRVSTTEQANEGYSIQGQKERLIGYCRAYNWIISDIYVDGGFSGSNISRPGIQKLISEVSKFDVVLVYKLDRLSRSQRDTLYLIEEVFLPNNVDFVSMNESFDTSTPFGKAMIGILSVFAQLEREQIKERMTLGKEERAKEGLYHGGGYVPVGYDYSGGKLVVNDYEAEQIRTIFRLYLEGLSTHAVADKMRGTGFTNKYGSWRNNVNVKRALTNEVYLGRIKYNDIVTPNAHEAIISKEDFDKVQKIRAQRHEIYGDMAFRGKFLLSSMIFCGRCGARYYMRHNKERNGTTRRFYSCYSRAKSVKSMIKDPECKNRYWKPDELEGIVEAEVRKVIFNPSHLKQIQAKREKQEMPSAPKKNNALAKRIAELDKQIDKLMALYQDDLVPANVLGEKITKLYEEKVLLQAQTAPPPQQEDFDYSLSQVIIDEAAAVWDFADITQKRRILENLIKRIVLDDDNVKIEWKI